MVIRVRSYEKSTLEPMFDTQTVSLPPFIGQLSNYLLVNYSLVFEMSFYAVKILIGNRFGFWISTANRRSSVSFQNPWILDFNCQKPNHRSSVSFLIFTGV